MRLSILAVGLLLGCATAEQPKETPPDSVPVAEVIQAVTRLKAEGLELVRQRDEALDLVDKLRARLINCESARSA